MTLFGCWDRWLNWNLWPPLEKIYVEKVPKEREPLNEIVSQYEIEKAIRWVKNRNVTSWMYGWLKE